METISPASPIFLVTARERILADNLPALWCYEEFGFCSQHEAHTRTEKRTRGFLPLSCDGMLPRLALSGELVMQTNEHTNPCLIKQKHDVDIHTARAASCQCCNNGCGVIRRGYKRIQRPAVSPAPSSQRFLSMQRKKKGKKRGSKKRISKQRRYAVSKQRTMVSGLAMVYLVLSALTERERARAGKN